MVILVDSAESAERLRIEVGAEWMRAKVIPYAASPPERLAGEVVTSYQRV